MSRIVGEWSAAFDILPEERLRDVMTGIKTNFTASFLLREISSKRKEFMRNFVEAQMVTYENAGGGTSRGWFYWTLKMEGGAFAEWDFLRGIKEGWIPEFPNPRTSCESVFGTCRAIAKRTKDDSSVIEEFPDPSDTDRIGWPGPVIDDDYVMSHAESSSSSGDKSGGGDDYDPTKQDKKKNKRPHWFRFFAMLLFGYGVWHVYLKDQFGFGRRRPDYQPLHSTSLTI
jgi:glucan 1,3-beta-glucosidase